MTRQQIEAEYTVVDGVIQDPGKFESEPVYVPYFWEFYLDGCADEDDGDVLTFDVDAEDRAQFPELVGVRQVFLWQTDQGFIGHDITRGA